MPLAGPLCDPQVALYEWHCKWQCLGLGASSTFSGACAPREKGWSQQPAPVPRLLGKPSWFIQPQSYSFMSHPNWAFLSNFCLIPSFCPFCNIPWALQEVTEISCLRLRLRTQQSHILCFVINYINSINSINCHSLQDAALLKTECSPNLWI